MTKLWDTKKQLSFAIIFCSLGGIIAALAVTIFLAPMKIPVGGFTGIATILSTSGLVNISIGHLTLLMNIPLFMFSYRLLGNRFGILSIISTLVYTLAMDAFARMEFITNLATQLDDIGLAVLYGSIVYGIGLGMIIKTGGSTGGSDMLAFVIGYRFNKHNLGFIIFYIDFIVLLMAAIVYKSFIMPLYAFLAAFLTAKVIDYLIEGGKRSKAYYIFTSKVEEISSAIIKELNRGATKFTGTGMYTYKERSMILCVVMRSQAAQLKKIVRNIDEHAFLFSTSVHEAFGEGFAPLKEKPKKLSDKNL